MPGREPICKGVTPAVREKHAGHHQAPACGAHYDWRACDKRCGRVRGFLSAHYCRKPRRSQVRSTTHHCNPHPGRFDRAPCGVPIVRGQHAMLRPQGRHRPMRRRHVHLQRRVDQRFEEVVPSDIRWWPAGTGNGAKGAIGQRDMHLSQRHLLHWAAWRGVLPHGWREQEL